MSEIKFDDGATYERYMGRWSQLARYEEAMQLAARCREILDQAEQRIQKIQLDAAGRPQVTPFEPPPAVAQEGEPCPPDEQG